MGRSLSSQPHIQLRRVEHLGGTRGLWHYTIVDAAIGGRTSGKFEAHSPKEAWRKLGRVIRRPNKQVWVRLTEAERMNYGLIVGRSAPPSPPPRSSR